MSGNTGVSYVDGDGNVFHSHGAKAKVTLGGSHFHSIIPMVTLVLSLLWFALFLAMFIALIVIRARSDKDSRARQYLKFPVMGFSTFAMMLYFATDAGDRIVHEMEITISEWYLVISLPKSILIGFAHGLLIAFLLWQLTPAVLYWKNSTEAATKNILWWFKLLTVFISLCDAADKIMVSVLYVKNTLTPIFSSQGLPKSKCSSTSAEVNILWCHGSDVEAASDATFNGLYLVCSIIFAFLAWKALQCLKERDTIKPTLRIHLALLTAAMVGRSTVDFVWSIVFKVATVFRSINLTFTAQLVYTLLYGALSVTVYYCILRISTLDDEGDAHVRYDIVEQTKNWQQRAIAKPSELIDAGARALTERAVAAGKRTQAQRVDVENVRGYGRVQQHEPGPQYEQPRYEQPHYDQYRGWQ